jgi:ATP-dependent Lon protease
MQHITAETSVEMSKAQREHILRKHLEAIQRELGESDPERSEVHDLRERLDSAGLSAEARKEALRELDRLARIPAASPEHAIIRTYLDWLLTLPWRRTLGGPIDLDRARAVLDEDHYDLEKVKDRILEYLAVKRLREKRRAEGDPGALGLDGDSSGREPILCFLGPPGVGKTSLGQSIARAMGRRFERVSLGGIHDEAEIRGHRRTYIGAMPGRIVQAVGRAEAADPVFMLDEVDKLGVGVQGDPFAALLEVLDPAQNHAFVDNYLGVPFDLSRILFICTANTTETIPPPLLDRMEVLQLAGYTDLEKLHIARRFLLPKQLRTHGLRPGEVVLDDNALRRVVREYTREVGVRSLERELAAVLRKAVRRIGEGAAAPIAVAGPELPEYLGPQRFFDEVAERIDRPGVATGLAWTPNGGDILFVEAAMMPGREESLILTGMLGSVMRESAQAALSYLRSNAERLGIDPEGFRQKAVHVHVPAGAIPKDGPSAGLPILVALASQVSGRPVRADLAMTGEITLRGKVLPVGGIKEKVLAAHRAGLRTLILPRRNQGALGDVPEEVRRATHLILVESVDEVMRVALGLGPGPEAQPSYGELLGTRPPLH